MTLPVDCGGISGTCRNLRPPFWDGHNAAGCFQKGMGSVKRGVHAATPLSGAALGRDQPYLQNREEKEDLVSHRKPGGWILCQLNHRVSSELARQLRQCPSPRALALAVGCEGTECLPVPLLILIYMCWLRGHGYLGFEYVSLANAN